MTIRYPTLPAEAITALGTLRRALALMPKNTVGQCLEVDMEVAGILELIADEIEGTDADCVLRNAASDLVGSVVKTRECMALEAADELERRRAA